MMNHEEILDIEEIQEPKELTDLSWIGRAITANNRHIAQIKEFRDSEVEKIKACCDQKFEKLTEDSSYKEGMASVVMKTHGYTYDDKNMRKYQMPGIGTFRFSVTRESVDSSEYDEADDQTKAGIQAGFPTLFSTKTTISPNKKALKTFFSNGDVVSGFKLKPKFEKFEFKGE